MTTRRVTPTPAPVVDPAEVAAVLAAHAARIGWGGGSWNAECLNSDCRFTAYGQGRVRDAHDAFAGHIADALTPVFAKAAHSAAAAALIATAAKIEAVAAAEMPHLRDDNPVKLDTQHTLRRAARIVRDQVAALTR